MPMLTDFSPEAVIPAIDDGLAAYRSVYAHGPAGNPSPDGGAVRMITGAPHVMLNGIYRARFRDEDADARIEGLIAPVMGKLPFHWWVSPASTPANLGDRLVAHGMKKGGSAPGMAIEIARGAKPHPIPGVAIRRATTIDEYSAATPLIVKSFGIPEHLEAFATAERAMWAAGNHAHHVRLTAWIDGRPVSTGSLTDAGGVASLDAIATDPEFRGRGLGYTITVALLELARERGYSIAVLEASDMGFPIYERIGFATFCEYVIYSHFP